MTKNSLVRTIKEMVVKINSDGESGLNRANGEAIPTAPEYADIIKEYLTNPASGSVFNLLLEYERHIVTFLDKDVKFLYSNSDKSCSMILPNDVFVPIAATSIVCSGWLQKFSHEVKADSKKFFKYKLKVDNHNPTCIVARYISFDGTPDTWKVFTVSDAEVHDGKTLSENVFPANGMKVIVMFQPTKANLVAGKKDGDGVRLFFNGTVDCMFIGDIPKVSPLN